VKDKNIFLEMLYNIIIALAMIIFFPIFLVIALWVSADRESEEAEKKSNKKYKRKEGKNDL